METIDPALLQQILTLNEQEVIVPLRVNREDVHKIKAVKLSDAEVATVINLQDYLYTKGYLADNTFASLFVYTFNLTYTLHKQQAELEAKQEVTP